MAGKLKARYVVAREKPFLLEGSVLEISGGDLARSVYNTTRWSRTVFDLLKDIAPHGFYAACGVVPDVCRLGPGLSGRCGKSCVGAAPAGLRSCVSCPVSHQQLEIGCAGDTHTAGVGKRHTSGLCLFCGPVAGSFSHTTGLPKLSSTLKTDY